MSYNGIGLTTVRGSGTNGYVQRNLSALRRIRDHVGMKSEEEMAKLDSRMEKKPNAELLMHDLKRRVEVKCMELQDLMEEQGYPEEEITKKVDSYRQMLSENQESLPGKEDSAGRPIVTETHQIAEMKERENENIRAAFGIRKDYVKGSAFENVGVSEKKTKEAQQRYDIVRSPSRSPPKEKQPKQSKKHKRKKQKRKKREASSSDSESDSSESEVERKVKRTKKSTKAKAKSDRKDSSSSEPEDNYTSKNKVNSSPSVNRHSHRTSKTVPNKHKRPSSPERSSHRRNRSPSPHRKVKAKISNEDSDKSEFDERSTSRKKIKSGRSSPVGKRSSHSRPGGLEERERPRMPEKGSHRRDKSPANDRMKTKSDRDDFDEPELQKSKKTKPGKSSPRHNSHSRTEQGDYKGSRSSQRSSRRRNESPPYSDMKAKSRRKDSSESDVDERSTSKKVAKSCKSPANRHSHSKPVREHRKRSHSPERSSRRRSRSPLVGKMKANFSSEDRSDLDEHKTSKYKMKYRRSPSVTKRNDLSRPARDKRERQTSPKRRLRQRSKSPSSRRTMKAKSSSEDSDDSEDSDGSEDSDDSEDSDESGDSDDSEDSTDSESPVSKKNVKSGKSSPPITRRNHRPSKTVHDRYNPPSPERSSRRKNRSPSPYKRTKANSDSDKSDSDDNSISRKKRKFSPVTSRSHQSTTTRGRYERQRSLERNSRRRYRSPSPYDRDRQRRRDPRR